MSDVRALKILSFRILKKDYIGYQADPMVVYTLKQKEQRLVRAVETNSCRRYSTRHK
jgi:hypothetical protein